MNIAHQFGTILTSVMLVLHLGSGAVSLPTAPHSQAPKVLAEQEYSLLDRYKVESVNSVFADNILLTLSYMDGQTKEGQPVNWDQVHKPGQYQFDLKPGQTFAFHDQILNQYKNSVVQTTNAHFNSTEKFKSDGWLIGDGVCHLASFINVVSSKAGLSVDAPTKHDFAAIPDVAKQFGTAIYYVPGEASISSKQNLYVTNTSDKTIAFVFNHTQDSLKIAVEKVN